MALDLGESQVSEVRTFAMLNGVSLSHRPLESNIGQSTADILFIVLPSVRCSRARTRVGNFTATSCHVCP
jgi:hypothetical protein